MYHSRKEGHAGKRLLASKPHEGMRVHAKGGHIVIKFKRHKRSNGGRGFVLVFHSELTINNAFAKFTVTLIGEIRPVIQSL